MSETAQSEHQQTPLAFKPQAAQKQEPRLPLPDISSLWDTGVLGGGTADSAHSVFGHFTDVLTAGGQVFPFKTEPKTPQVGPTLEAARTGHLAGPPAGAAHHTPSVAEYRSGVDAHLDTEIKANRTTRAGLDKDRAAHLPTVGDTEHQLNGDRQHLLDELNERSGVYNHDIHDINAKLGDKLPKNLTPEQKALVAQRTSLTQERDKYKDQQTALQRWHDRREINSINERLKDPKLDPKVKQQLLAEKKKLATGLLSTTKHYEQFDPRWGDTVYGKDRSYTTMTEAGCGPTGLAMMMDFRDQEDPEGQHSRGVQDPYTPRKMANYATNHGRVKGSGTDGTQMMGDLSGSFPGFEGHTVSNRAEATESLHNGVPVMFLGHDVHGTRADGEDTKYGGHYMLLNGVSDDNKTFQVNDGGRNSNRNIRSMSARQLDDGSAGYWTVNHKP